MISAVTVMSCPAAGDSGFTVILPTVKLAVAVVVVDVVAGDEVAVLVVPPPPWQPNIESIVNAIIRKRARHLKVFFVPVLQTLTTLSSRLIYSTYTGDIGICSFSNKRKNGK
jgi:hypothetical protein